MIYENINSLTPIVSIINEAQTAVNNKNHTIKQSAISQPLHNALNAELATEDSSSSGVGAALAGGVVGGLAGGGISLTALYFAGTTGFSAVGLTSGLAAMGSIIGCGFLGGIGVFAAGVALPLAGGAWLFSAKARNKLEQEKQRLYQQALQKHETVIQCLKSEANSCQERLDELNGLNILLRRAVEELKRDLKKECEA